MKNQHYNKLIVMFVIFFLILSPFLSNVSGFRSNKTLCKESNLLKNVDQQKNTVVKCQTFGLPGKNSNQASIPQELAESFYEKIKTLQTEMSTNPGSETTKQLQHEIITLSEEYNLLPEGITTKTLEKRLSQFSLLPKLGNIKANSLTGKETETFCTFVTAGSGSSFPIIVLPRFMPLIMTPIPRVFMRWSGGSDSMTSCGGLQSGTGFIAYGEQTGHAIGFWGIGFTFSLPPIVGAYGLIGIAGYVTVEAENLQRYPTKPSPQITDVYPENKVKDAPVYLSNISFRIEAPANSDNSDVSIDYWVNTEPDIGSGSGTDVRPGVYKVPVSGLKGLTKYTWEIKIDDGYNLYSRSYSFTTEEATPIISNPNPSNGSKFISTDITQLSFDIFDYQDDLMDYTVKTTPNIGSYIGTDVKSGTCTVDVSGLEYITDYSWIVNVTDGINWNEEEYHFQTEPKMNINPFDEGWNYRKKITIDHTKVTGDFTNFQILIDSVDVDLRDKAQNDGDDIIFMKGVGFSKRLYHEIEEYDESTGKLIAWVNIPSISSTENTNLYMYYGNPSCNSQQLPEGVWNSELMVLHMKDDPDASNIRDSTGYDNDGIKRGRNEPIETAGKIGKGQYFDGLNDYIDTKDFDINDDFTVSLYINPSSTDYGQCFISKHTSGGTNLALFGYWGQNPSGYSFHIRDDKYREGTMTTGWKHMVFVGEKIGSSRMKATIYINGELLGQQYLDNTVGDVLGKPWTIGQDWDYSERTDFFNGVIDEVRIANSVKNSDWIVTEYNNQNNPTSFLSFGSEES